MNVVLVSNPPDVSSGTGQYADRWSDALDTRVDVEHVFVPVDARSPLPFVRAATDFRIIDADVIHVQHDYVVFGPLGIYTCLFFSLLYLTSRLASVPIVVTAHEVLNGAHVTPPFRRLKLVYVGAMNLAVAGAADRLVFLSEEARSRFTDSASSDAATLIPHGVDDVPVDTRAEKARNQFGVDPDDVLVVEPGYVSPRKGSDVLVDLAERRPDWEFLLAGGPPRAAHESFVERLRQRAPENVTITGRLPEDDFHAAFAAADVAVLPYNEIEQTGIVNAVNQSGVFNWCAAHRVPVAASDCPRFRAVNERWDCPALFDITDLEDVAACVESLLTDEERDSATTALAEYAAANAMEQVADRHVELYEELVR